MTRTNGVRLLLVAAMALLLLTCTVAAWALPHTRPSTPPGGAASSTAAVDDRCRWIIGPAHDYCTSAIGEPTDTVRPTHRAAIGPAGLDGRSGLLLFSTLAIAGAIALVSTAGRRL